MLILYFVDENVFSENKKRKFSRKKKCEKKNEIRRYSIIVNGKNVVVLELTEKDLENEDVLTILKVYKSRVLVSARYAEKGILNEYLYNPNEYYKRALLSSFVNQVKTVNKDWKNILIKTHDFKPFREFYDIVRLSKKVTILTEATAYTESFIKACYYEYGAIVNVSDDGKIKSDVFLDLDKIDKSGKLMINVKGKDFLLYPDTSFFENSEEYQKLNMYNIDYNIMCAAFSDK